MMSGELSFVRGARLGLAGAADSVDSPSREQRLATKWEQLGKLCVRRDRCGQSELKGRTLP